MDESRSAGPPTWRSLAEYQDAPPSHEARSHEFVAGVTDQFSVDGLPAISRKKFLAMLTASAAFAAAGCTGYRDKGEIVPYGKKPEEITPGVADLYASTCSGCSQACGVLLKTREGRPIKVDGNPDHPVNRGAVCASGQASIMNLYDPNRLRSPRGGSGLAETTWATADAAVRDALSHAAAAGKEIALVTGRVSSPTTARVIGEFLKAFPTTRWYSYDILHDENRRAAWESCYGSAPLPVIAWEKAKVILTLEADLLGTEGFVVEQIRKYAEGKDVIGAQEISRLYAVEGAMTITGAHADHRLRLRPDALGAFVRMLQGAAASGAPASACDDFAKRYGLPAETLRALVRDLLAHRGEGIVYAGSALPVDVHLAVNALNELLGNARLYLPGVMELHRLTPPEEWKALVARMKKGNVAVAIHLEANPLFHLPESLSYGEGLAKVPTSVSLVEQEDETSASCALALPVHTMFESWGDFQPRPGVLSLQQPVVEPLYGNRQKEGVLLAWMSADGTYGESLYHAYLMKRWEGEVYPVLKPKAEFRPFWLSSLHDGVIDVPTRSAPLRPFAHPATPVPEDPQGFLLALRPAHFVGDGRFANNGWLQELPHPISKVVWDNYAACSPETARELGLDEDGLIEITVGSTSRTLPVLIQPGQADHVVSVELGYGRKEGGPIGSDVGTEVQSLLPFEAITGPRIVRGARISRAEGRGTLVTTQEHHAIDDGPLAERLKDIHLKRKIIREGTLEEYRKDPGFLQEEKPELFNIAASVEYNGVKWAMSIDLNKCVGCNACVAGCNVENNIAVVGKDQVGRGREMQWLRIDRYYAGSPDDPRLSHQPMLCQHCDNAPCENVCPVVATTHSPDGLNQMAYNRCVGTKYCSNNCPYKVRRFNFYNFRQELVDGYYTQDPVALMHNPEVTVRSRGVMEKCTFCIQRITEARQHATEQGRALNGNDVTTACQQACPAQAIVFGDMNDPASTISARRKHPLGYSVLEELNVRPNVTYIARLRNTHPEKNS